MSDEKKNEQQTIDCPECNGRGMVGGEQCCNCTGGQIPLGRSPDSFRGPSTYYPGTEPYWKLK